MFKCGNVCKYCTCGNSRFAGKFAYSLVMANDSVSQFHANANFAPDVRPSVIVRRLPLAASKKLRERFEETHKILA